MIPEFNNDRAVCATVQLPTRALGGYPRILIRSGKDGSSAEGLCRSGQGWREKSDRGCAKGFSLIEMLVSVAIITVLMAAVFQFLRFNQQRYRGDQLLAERNQGARSALELMTQELQQAGENPNFSPNKSLTAAITTLVNGISNVTVNNTTGIFYGNLLEIGSSAADPNREIVEVKGDATHPITATTFPAIVTLTHANGQPVFSKSLPFPNSIIFNSPAVTTNISPVPVNTIQFYGDIEGNGTLLGNASYLGYGEYFLLDTGLTSTIQCCTPTTINCGLSTATAMANCHKFELKRYVTNILNPEIPTAKAGTSSAVADNILGYPDTTGTPCNITATANLSGIPCNPDRTPILQLNYETFGNLTFGMTTYVRSVDVSLTMQTVDKDPEVNDYRIIRMKSHIVPTNISYAWGITMLGGSPDLPFQPTDSSGHTIPALAATATP